MPDQIHELRNDIDRIDSSLIELLSKRMQLSHEIGAIKKGVGIPPLDKERWQELIEKCIRAGTAKGLSREYILDIFEVIHRHSLKEQKDA